MSSEKKPRFVEFKEGLVRFIGPDISLYSKGRLLEPSWAPVFYNPRMKLSRDIGVALIDAFSEYSLRKGLIIAEPLSATGIRGLRYLVENKGKVDMLILNDHNKLAYNLLIKNAEINGVYDKVRAYNLDVELLLYKLVEEELRPDVIDLDPFGSPGYFLDAAVKTIKHKGMICMTATDLPTLFGHYPLTAYRRYMVRVCLTDFYKECGIRVLLGFTAREAARMDRGIRPLFSQATDHYIRLCVLVYKSRRKALISLKSLGYVEYCDKCLYRNGIKDFEVKKCPLCRSRLKVIGPVWLGPLWDVEFLSKTLSAYSSRTYLERRGIKILQLMIEEAEAPPLYYRTSSIARKYAFKREVSPKKIAEFHRSVGISSSLTHFDDKGFRSPLDVGDVVKLIKKLI